MAAELDADLAAADARRLAAQAALRARPASPTGSVVEASPTAGEAVSAAWAARAQSRVAAFPAPLPLDTSANPRPRSRARGATTACPP